MGNKLCCYVGKYIQIINLSGQEIHMRTKSQYTDNWFNNICLRKNNYHTVYVGEQDAVLIELSDNFGNIRLHAIVNKKRYKVESLDMIQYI
jgi:hypothetical protein